jgi:hypothetical protein
MPSALATSAVLWQLDDFGTGAHCEGDQVVGGFPVVTHRFHAGEQIEMQLTPGNHTVVLWALADEAATELLASACAEKFMPAGGQICLDLALDAAPDGATLPDFSMPPPCDSTCGTTCCRGLHGSCDGNCAVACEAGYADCNGDVADGCEQALDSIDHCGGCNQKCDTTTVTGTPTCDGTQCQYTGCLAGYINCSQSGGDANGCECAGSMCCSGGTCELQHSAGLNSVTYQACDALGTPSTGTAKAMGYTELMARAACAAWVAAKDPSRICLTAPVDCGGNNLAICTNGTKNCPCWTYQDSDAPPSDTAGHVYSDPRCTYCPALSDPTWN